MQNEDLGHRAHFLPSLPRGVTGLKCAGRSHPPVWADRVQSSGRLQLSYDILAIYLHATCLRHILCFTSLVRGTTPGKSLFGLEVSSS